MAWIPVKSVEEWVMKQEQDLENGPVPADAGDRREADVEDWLVLPIIVMTNASVPIVGFSALRLAGWSSDTYPMIMLVCGLTVFLTVLAMLRMLVRRSKARRHPSSNTSEHSGKRAP